MATNVFNNAPVSNVGTSDALIYENSAVVGTETIVLQLDVTNITAGARAVTAWVDRGGVKTHLCYNAPLPVGSTLQVIYGQKTVLKTTAGPIRDKIYVKTDTAAGVDVMCSVLEDV
jgi:hypothetical protein